MWSLLVGLSKDSQEIVAGDEGNIIVSPKAMSTEHQLTHKWAASDLGVQESSSASVEIKHGEQLCTPAREEGDGMESGGRRSSERKNHLTLPLTLPLTKVGSNSNFQGHTDVSTSESLGNSPLATFPRHQMVQLGGGHQTVARQQHLSMEKNSTKEPKFVPYEPYKAAITPLNVKKAFPAVKHAKKSSSLSATKKRSRPLRMSSQGMRPSHSTGNLEDSSRSKSEIDADARPPTSAVDIVASPEAQDDKSADFMKLKSKLAESEKQLKIQLQVNSEVKKLLVASVGEDIEARVDHLTQDKARLAADIRHYSTKIAKDFEDKEKLSVESELWKSKFLASSVIVDELAGWKASLMLKRDETDHYIRLLMHERQLLFDTLNRSMETLNSLKLAFDPLSVGGAASKSLSAQASPTSADLKTVERLSVLGLADLVDVTSEELHERLLGRNEARLKNVGTRGQSEGHQKMGRKILDTPAEEGLKNALSPSCSTCSAEDYSTRASAAITGAAKPHLAKLTDKLMTPSPTKLRCCTHCQGSIQNV